MFFFINNEPMNKDQKGFAMWLLAVVMVAIIAAVGGYVLYKHHKSTKTQSETTSCQPNSMSGSCCSSNPIPGHITITVPGNISRQEIQTLIKPIHGTLVNYSQYGLDGINVKVGSENKAIEYLKKQSWVQDAWQADNLCPQ
jgi:hypothetical protein